MNLQPFADRFNRSVHFISLDKEFALAEVDAESDSICINDWIYLSCEEVEKEFNSIAGKKMRKVIQWRISWLVYDPGVRYYPDGSGEPPSEELVEGELYENFEYATIAVLNKLITERINDGFQAEAEIEMEKLAEQLEDY